jgi:5-methyltetrahydropteroyltriglutamate--homocysteine methyltransferase
VQVEAFYADGHSAVLADERGKDRTGLRALEDQAIRDVVRRQVELGLDVVTDGELRRWMFLNSFYDAVEGFRTDNVVNFRNARGEECRSASTRSSSAFVRRLAGRPGGGVHGRRRRRLPVQGHVPRAVTVRPPVLVQAGRDLRVRFAREFVAHAIQIEHGLVADAIRAGTRYVQFDFPLYPYLVDPAWVERFEAQGHRVADLVEAAIAADTAVLEGIPDGVTVALHICRGNYRSSWMCEGSLEPIAERVFGELPYDAFLVEWDNLGRDGGFEPVRFLRRGSTMVMGIVSTKTPVLEDEDGARAEMEQAAASPAAWTGSRSAAVRVRERDGGQRDRRGRAVAQARLVSRVADRLWG